MGFIQAFSQGEPGGYDYAWDDYPDSDFGPLVINFDYTGVRDIEHAPDAGIHPRIYFNPSDVPEIKNRLTTTSSGQEIMAQVHAFTTLLNLGYTAGGYNHNYSYGSDSFGNKRIDNPGKWDSSDIYEDLVNEIPTALDGVDTKRRYLLSSVMALEAFECLMMEGEMDSDTGMDYDTRASNLATAMAYWAELVLGDPDLNWNNYNYFGGEQMALCYDINFNAMTVAQQDLVREALAEIIPSEPRYGAETDPYATTSNWVGLNTFEILTNLAIEDELGYNESLTIEYMRAYRKFLNYGFYESGTPYEGMGKNYQFVSVLVAMAKRGYSLLGHPYVRNYGNNFLAAITQPYGHSFTSTDVWGGSGWDNEIGGYKFNPNDAVGLKWAFPDDSGIDFMWRNYIGEFYKNNSTGYVYQSIEPTSNGYHNHMIPAAIFALDYESGDFAVKAEEALESESYFAPERGLAIIRSGFEQDDMMMHFHCRQDLGGHTHGDRNSFAMSALGRIWMRYTFGSEFQETEYHSTILIDDIGIKINPKDGKKARMPGSILGFSDIETSAQVSGDATYAYSWEWDWESRPSTQDHSQLGINGWEAVTETWNDFRYQAGAEDYHNLSFYDYAHWKDPFRLERMVKRPYNTMERVYRTAAMIRGDYPFLIIADDVQKDQEIHNYKWLGQMASDLVVHSTDVNFDYNDYKSDIILEETGGNRRLLIRVLNNNDYCSHQLQINGEPASATYHAGGSVISDAKIKSDSTINFYGGTLVELQAGFEAEAGSIFVADNENCSNDNYVPGYLETLTPGINGNNPITRLVVEADVVSPDFRILLYPHNAGDVLPTTSWNEDKTEVTVTIDGQSNVIGFNVTNGKTEVVVD